MIKPVGHKILVKPDTVETVSKGGIILVDETVNDGKRHVDTGTLVAVGHQAWMGFGDSQPWAKVGDRIVFERYGGSKYTDGDIEYRIMNDEDIDAIIKEA